ncbi:MAG: MarR family winged helix-turn-helix transcriptional regulator [Eubacteriales bacterium]
MNRIEYIKYIFGSIFLLSNKLQVLGDQYLGREGISTKQWFLMVMISQFQSNLPTLSQVAELMGSSRQNVKQLALKLDEKGFVDIQKDKKDARVLTLALTEKSKLFWEERENQDDQFLLDLFKDFTPEEIINMNNGFNKLFSKIEKL